MREVKYERPPGFVDPFQEPPAEGKDSKAKAKKKESSSDDGDIDEVLASILDDNKGAGATGKATSSAHVNRVRAVRRANKKGSNIQLSKSATTGNTLDSESRNQRNGINSEGNAASMDEDSFFPAMLNSADDGEEDREDLAYIQRTIRVTEENLNASESTDLMSNTSLVSAKGHRIMVYSLNAELQSWLVNGQVMVIFASTTEEFVHLEAEAEISLSDLAVIRGLPADYSFESDRSFLQSIAKEIVNNVELKVEKGVARIVLNLVGESDIDFENEPNEKSNQELLLNSSLSQSHASQEEIERMLLEGIIIRMFLKCVITEFCMLDRSNLDLKQGSLVPVVFNVSHALQAANSIHNVVELARKAKNVEHLHALIRITTTPDDQVIQHFPYMNTHILTIHLTFQLLISMTFLSNSNMMFKKNLSSTRPAVTAGSRITMLAPLPSIVQADPDMIPVYAKNLFPSLRVEHDLKLGTNHITISS